MSAVPTAMDEFIARYRPDINLFVREVFEATPYAWQIEAGEEYNRCMNGEGRMSIRSGHAVGKSTFECWMMCHRLTCFFPQKTVVTSANAPQLYDALWPEFKTWLGRLPKMWHNVFEVKAERVEHKASPSECFVSARTARKDTPEALAGVHCEDGWVLLLADEASGIDDAVYEAGTSSMAGTRVITVLTGNPVRGTGKFHRTQTKLAGSGPGEWWTKHISTLDIPGEWPKSYAAGVEKDYGRDSNAYRVRVLGEFPVVEDNTIIPFYLVEAAAKRQVIPAPRTSPVVWGVDCARFGDDASALCKRRTYQILEPIQTRTKYDTMALAAWIKAEYDTTAYPDRPAQINVDVLNMGAGVVDRLIQLGLPARGINVSESPGMRNRELYANLRAELWFRMKEWFQAQHCWIPEDPMLIEELTRPLYDFRPATQKMFVEEKRKTQARIGRSPDRADAMMLTFASDEATLLHGSKFGVSNWKSQRQRTVSVV